MGKAVKTTISRVESTFSRLYYTPSEFDNRVGIDNGKGSKNHYFPSIVY